MPSTVPPLSERQLDAYGARLGLIDLTAGGSPPLDELCLAHLRNVPFENLDQVFAGGVPHDLDASVEKILGGRGGWCFELNGAFARLLVTIGFDVMFIGCAVLLDGPSRRIEHVALEVAGGSEDRRPHLVDVGFGDSFVFPLDLNRRGPQPGGNGDYELLASPEGTTLARLDDGVPSATLRFKRVALDFVDFAPAAERLQTDPALAWSSKPFASRLVAPNERITLRHDARTRTLDGHSRVESVPSSTEWDRTLQQWFGLERPGPWPT